VRDSGFGLDFCETEDGNLDGRKAMHNSGTAVKPAKPEKPAVMISMLHAIGDKLTGISMSRQNNAVKTEILSALNEVIDTVVANVENDKNTMCPTEPITLEAERISNIERDNQAALCCVCIYVTRGQGRTH
jgi:hypothetical protein